LKDVTSKSFKKTIHQALDQGNGILTEHQAIAVYLTLGIRSMSFEERYLERLATKLSSIWGIDLNIRASMIGTYGIILTHRYPKAYLYLEKLQDEFECGVRQFPCGTDYLNVSSSSQYLHLRIASEASKTIMASAPSIFRHWENSDVDYPLVKCSMFDGYLIEHQGSDQETPMMVANLMKEKSVEVGNPMETLIDNYHELKSDLNTRL